MLNYSCCNILKKKYMKKHWRTKFGRWDQTQIATLLSHDHPFSNSILFPRKRPVFREHNPSTTALVFFYKINTMKFIIIVLQNIKVLWTGYFFIFAQYISHICLSYFNYEQHCFRHYMQGQALEERIHTALRTTFPVIEKQTEAFNPKEVINFLVTNILMGLCFHGKYVHKFLLFTKQSQI